MSKAGIHAAAGAVAMLCVISFWTSTAVSELFMDAHGIMVVKRAIVYAIPLMLVAMALTGVLGFQMAGRSQHMLIQRKKKRMPVIAATGLVVMIPLALFLYSRASAGRLDTVFYCVQAVELAVGLMQLTILALSFRDGLRLSHQRTTQG